jgi:aspartate aminotransferase
MSIPGARTGYCVINTEAEGYEDFVNVCVQISRCIGHNCPPTLMQLAVARDAGATSDLSVYEENRNILYKELTALGFDIVNPGGTFYMFPKALEDDAVAFCEKAKQLDLLLVPSNSFGVEGYFRIAYCVPTEKVRRSIEAFKKLAALYQ